MPMGKPFTNKDVQDLGDVLKKSLQGGQDGHKGQKNGTQIWWAPCSNRGPGTLQQDESTKLTGPV